MDANDNILVTALDQIEQQEAKLLTWGLVDGHITFPEVHEIIGSLLRDPKLAEGSSFSDTNEVVDELIRRRLIFDVGQTAGLQYRSRMAEGVRLIFRLRQLFHRHDGREGWQTAPTLVADFRFKWQRRQYPRRDIQPVDALEEISASAKNKATQLALDAVFRGLVEASPGFALAGFQVAATKRILSGFDVRRPIGTLVSAGTGSGKTLAFYLPALARIAMHLQRDSIQDHWVKVIAVYPRNELLKDQFTEVYEQARHLDPFLIGQRRRKLVIGALFGPTPFSAKAAENKRTGWKRAPDGLVCSYVPCPGSACDGEMIWRDVDRHASLERLECSSCGKKIESDEIILTRERLQETPPDILFTTTEMLNQRISDNRFRHLFGVGDRARRPAEMVLLDEVHTYSGRHGAQVGFLLRRWRKLVRHPLNFVGLSATLKDGENFLKQLIGLNENSVVEITPNEKEMISEGAEYLLALRGDPVSRTALLSTTIQTGMVLSRVLDPSHLSISEGLFGQRLFLFTDNLDVINRLYFSMLDAEGRDKDGRPINRQNYDAGGLAYLRRDMASQSRELGGQNWARLSDIGHDLRHRKNIGRVSSQDPGFKNNSDMIVATASLEVGFNDNRVGAVIQHKAPRDMAQFLQRKGRAGRSRGMRPWTVVVLSDYGRDRISYQGYDLLFDPEVPPRSLPMNNRYIIRIQAVYATLDYLRDGLANSVEGSVWADLSEGWNINELNGRWKAQRQSALATLVKNILTVPEELERYSDYLANALKIEQSVVISLLWETPRPLLTQVLPTALRRLESNWRKNGAANTDFKIRNSPLPEFATATLFGGLGLSEVSINLPQLTNSYSDQDPQQMPVLAALREFAPGRVSRRFGIRSGFDRHWLCPEIDETREQKISLEEVADLEVLGDWNIGMGSQLPVYYPRVLNVSVPENNIVDTSNAQLRWRSQLIAPKLECREKFSAPKNTNWVRLVKDIRFYTHEGSNPIDVRRMALGSDANIRFRTGQSLNKKFRFEVNGNEAALGFNLSADAMCIRLRFPEDLHLSLGNEDDVRYRAVRTARFHYEATRGELLNLIDNVFAREWLAQVLITAISNEAIVRGISLESAAARVADGAADLDLDQTLELIFQSPIVDDHSAEISQEDKLREELSAFLEDRQIVDRLFKLAEILWTPIDQTWEPWLRERFAATVGAAALSAITDLCPEIDEADLVIDLMGTAPEQDFSHASFAGGEVWISESAPGGNGQIEQLIRRYVDDPRGFFSLMTAALRDNDFTLSDYQLGRFLTIAVEGDSDEAIPTAVRNFRQASGAEETHVCFSELRHALAEEGFVTFHAFLVALVNRILRPGSGFDQDVFFLDAMRKWDDEEARLRIELDARVIAYQLSMSDTLDEVLRNSGFETPTIRPDQWRFGVIYGLLWPRGAHIRQSGLQSYSPFSELPKPEPLLLQAYLAEGLEVVDLSFEDWEEKSLRNLANNGAVTLSCPMTDIARLSNALVFFITNPVQLDYISVYARVRGTRRIGGDLHIDLDIAEAKQ